MRHGRIREPDEHNPDHIVAYETQERYAPSESRDTLDAQSTWHPSKSAVFTHGGRNGAQQ